MTLYEIRKCYQKQPIENIHAMYREIELDAVDEHSYNRSALHIAASHADVGAVDILIERGIKASVQDKHGATPLHCLAELKTENGYRPTAEDIDACVERLLGAKVSPLRKTEGGKTCLHKAAEAGNGAFLAAMAARYDKLDLADSDGNTALHILCGRVGSAFSMLSSVEKHLAERREKAAANDHMIYQQQLESTEADYAKKRAEADGYVLGVRALVGAGADVTLRNNRGETPQDHLVERGMVKEVAAILAGDTIDPGDPDSLLRMQTGGMSLHMAIMQRDNEAVRANLALGADPDAISDEENKYRGLSALALALVEMNADAAEILMEAGSDPNLRDGKGFAAPAYLFTANASVNVGHRVFEERRIPRSFEAMKQGGLDIDAPVDDKGHTALCLAARAAHFGTTAYNSDTLPGTVMDILLDWDCDVNIPNNDGITPLMYLCGANRDMYENTIITLLEMNADIAAKDRGGKTALMYAAGNRDKAFAMAAADLLFTVGNPLPDTVNNDGKTALDIATDVGNENLVKLILRYM